MMTCCLSFRETFDIWKSLINIWPELCCSSIYLLLTSIQYTESSSEEWVVVLMAVLLLYLYSMYLYPNELLHALQSSNIYCSVLSISNYFLSLNMCFPFSSIRINFRWIQYIFPFLLDFFSLYDWSFILILEKILRISRKIF